MNNVFWKKFIIITAMVPICAFLSSCKKEPEIDLLLNSSQTHNNVPNPDLSVMNKPKVHNEGEIDTNVPDEIVVVSVENFGRMDPFLPYKEKNLVVTKTQSFSEIPLPPDISEKDPLLDQITQAKVTGILYDAIKPSALVDILGEEYLVRPGDIIANFQIDEISKDYVEISAGMNTYKAHIGEVIDGTISTSNIPDIQNRFAGGNYYGHSSDSILIKPISDINE